MNISIEQKANKIEEVSHCPRMINAGFIAFADLLNTTVDDLQKRLLEDESLMNNFHSFVLVGAIAIVSDKCAEMK